MVAYVREKGRKPSICIVLPYFGRLPYYADLFFRSCAANPDVNWLLITDGDPTRELPANVTHMRTTFADIRSLISRKLGFDVALPHPYKLCDFKPAYGFLFEDLLEGYDFWGHCDMDMIFGSIRKFITDDVLKAYSKVLVRGHLSLYRNSEEAKTYFQLTAPGLDYRDVFRDPRNRSFDEWAGIYKILKYHGIPQFHDEFIVDVEPYRHYKFIGTKIHNYAYQVFFWYQGKVLQSYLSEGGCSAIREFAYIHFQKRRFPQHSLGFDPYSVAGFYITPRGFFPYEERVLTREDYKELNPDGPSRVASHLLVSPRHLWTREASTFIDAFLGHLRR